MNNSFSNYYLKCDNHDDIIKFCQSLYSQLIESNLLEKIKSPIYLSFSNLHFLLDISKIISSIQRYNINLISSFRIKTKENIELLIFNPKQTAKEILIDLELERTIRLLLILEELKNKYFLIFDYNELNKQKELKYINEYDLSKIIFKQIKTYKNLYKHLNIETISDVYEIILKDLYKFIPNDYRTYDIIISKLDGLESIYLTYPQNNIEYINDERIDGIIYNHFTPIDVIKFAKKQRKDILFGTGEYI